MKTLGDLSFIWEQKTSLNFPFATQSHSEKKILIYHLNKIKNEKCCRTKYLMHNDERKLYAIVIHRKGLSLNETNERENEKKYDRYLFLKKKFIYFVA
jgi:hypothetical protein